jgi:hypothetical protein
LGGIKRSLGVLAATAVAAVGVSTGPASAAIQPTARQMAAWQAAISHVQQPGSGCYHASYPSLRWHAVRCVTAPKLPLVPASRSARRPGAAAVGDGHDYSAQVPGLISRAAGTFKNVSPGISEKGTLGGSGPKIANSFSLQLNTQFVTGSPACSGSSKPAKCQAWQQFVYTYQNRKSGYVFMQYWLINYDATCPPGWMAYSADCYTNSNAVAVKAVTAKQLATVRITASAKAHGKDVASLSVGSGSAASVSGKDTKVHLAKFWNTTEWGVYGDGGGSEAYFGTGATLQAQTALTASSGSSAPTCVSEGFTGETNNLKLAHTPALRKQSSPTLASRQTNGEGGTASCAAAT